MQFYNTAAGGKAELPYKIIKDGHGNEYQVIDLDNKEICPNEGVVIFEATTRKNESRANEIPFKMCKDKLTGVLIGICTGINQTTKNLSWLPIYLEKSKLFNLENRDDAMKAACLIRSNIVIGSPNLASNEKLALFRVHDEQKAAANTIQRINDSVRAIGIAGSLYGESLKNMAMNIGVPTEFTNDSIMLAAVMERAQKNPAEFLRIYENPNRESITIFNKAYKLGIITHDPITGYYFRGVPIGINENFICEYFNKYPDVKGSISSMCEERERQTVKPTKTVEVDPEKEALKKQLEEMRLKLEAMNKPKEATEDLQAELEALKKEAAEIGGNLAKGLHHFTATRESIDKLKEKLNKEKV